MKKLTSLKWLVLLLLNIINRVFSSTCVNMWDASYSDLTSAALNTNICEVKTDSGVPCQFPFTFNSVSYKSCVITNNLDALPQCITTANVWSNCIGTLKLIEINL